MGVCKIADQNHQIDVRPPRTLRIRFCKEFYIGTASLKTVAYIHK